jgi:hypothetical protein
LGGQWVRPNEIRFAWFHRPRHFTGERQRYFAELVNPIPRGLWKDKPEIGIDYAIARGQLWAGQAAGQAGVGATISTGMIGQGVVNFGPFFGVLAAGR